MLGTYHQNAIIDSLVISGDFGMRVKHEPMAADSPPMTCIGDGCERPPVARSMCLMHYKRFKKYGTTVFINTAYGCRAESQREKRTRAARWERVSARVHDWSSKQHFLADVGEPPTLGAWLIPIDRNKPIGPDNWRWSPTGKHREETKTNWGTREGRIAYLRSLQEADPLYQRRVSLKKNYGLTLEQYDAMSEAQEHVCAVCGQPETMKKHGRLLPLAVDHDHSTGKIRGLLCHICNRGLGLLGDNLRIVIAAADYLARYEGRETVVTLATKENAL